MKYTASTLQYDERGFGYLKDNQFVVFEDGTMEGFNEARWSKRANAFYTIREDEDGERYKIYSTEVVEKEKKKRAFKPSKKNCTIEIHPVNETEKCYIVEDGTNGVIGIKGRKEYYKTIAKSICYKEDGRVFAPKWAVQ